MRKLLCVIAILGFAGCAGDPVRYAVPSVEPGDRIRISSRSVEVVEVSLPTYARTEEIWQEGEDGALISDPEVLWADEPTRGVTQELTRYLSVITGAQIAAEPWPFDEPAAARLDVRLDEMIASRDGTFRISGQYFTSRYSGGRDRASAFRVAAPIAPESGLPGIAAARAAAFRELARQIASAGI